MTTQLLTIGPDAQASRSVIRVQKAKVKNQQSTYEFTEQRIDDAPARTFTLTCHELIHPHLLN